MYQIIMDYEQSLQQNQCTAPVVFKASGGGQYQAFADYAAQTGRAAQWLAWTEDEPCPQQTLEADTETEVTSIPFCSIGGTPAGNTGTGGAGGTGTGGSGGAAGAPGTGGSTATGSCVGHCGAQAPGGCWCDTGCSTHSDCCADKLSACGA